MTNTVLLDQQPKVSVFADAQDGAIVEEVYGTTVTFLWEGCSGVYPRQQLEGVILDVKTTKRGERLLLVKAHELNLPHWVRLQDVQFPLKQTAAAA